MPEPTGGRPLLLCADDYGLSPAVDQAVAALVRAGRLSAFSCLSNGPTWPQAASQVPALRRQAQAGLHLNLSEGRPLSAALAARWPQLPALPRLLLLAHAGLLPLEAVHAELAAQWAAFVAATGAEPDFLDGHQHVHHLPGVRDWVLERAASRGVPVRSTARVAGPGPAFKRWVIEHSGGQALARGLRQRGLPHHPLLLGAYGFDDTDYRGLMQRWLAQVPAAGALLFCHPGLAAPAGPLYGVPEDGPDAIAPARQREYAYLAGDEFPADLAAAGVVLATAWPAAGGPLRPAPGRSQAA